MADKVMLQTQRCVVCLSSKTKIVTGHVVGSNNIQVLSAFCSDACTSRRIQGGPWKKEMGVRAFPAKWSQEDQSYTDEPRDLSS